MKNKLLLVDDELDLLVALKQMLAEPDRDVVTASNGAEALVLIHQQHVHCIVCDINMPIMNGIELIRKLRSEGNQVPLIFFTGHGNDDMLKQAAQLGAFDFIDKPNFTDLREIVSRGLAAGRKASTELPVDSKLSLYRRLLEGFDP